MTILSPTRTTPNFNPRTPRGVRRGPSGSRTAGGNISIHAPRAGRDSASMTHFFASPLFQSTRPMRGATVGPGDIPAIEKPFQSTHPMRGATSNTPRPPIDHGISIHAPHAGRDRCRRSDRRGKYYFNPRAPCGARHVLADLNDVRKDFNPRAPCGARRASIDDLRTVQRSFQSTRPVRGATSGCPAWYSSAWHFNPRAPCGARRAMTRTGTPSAGFQSTRPVRGATRSTRTAAPPCIFQSTRPVRGATWL